MQFTALQAFWPGMLLNDTLCSTTLCCAHLRWCSRDCLMWIQDPASVLLSKRPPVYFRTAVSLSVGMSCWKLALIPWRLLELQASGMSVLGLLLQQMQSVSLEFWIY